MRSSIVAGAGTLNLGLTIYFNSGKLDSVESRPEPVSVSLPALPPLFELEWLVKPAAGADFVAEDLKALARLLLTAPLRAPVEARETWALLVVPPLRPLGAAGFKLAGAGDRPGGGVPDAKPLAEALPTAGAGAEPSTHTPSDCLPYGKLPFPAVQLELPPDILPRPEPQLPGSGAAFWLPKLPFPAVQLELPLNEPPPPAGFEPFVASVFALFAPAGLDAEVSCALAACMLKAKATANTAMKNAFLRFAQYID